MHLAASEGVWTRTTSRNCLTRVPSKSCSVMPCVMACHRQSPMTLGWPKSMRRLKGRSSCKCECWRKRRRTTRIWLTHSGLSPNGATKLYNWSWTGLDGGRTITAHWTSTWSTMSQAWNAASTLHARRTSCSGEISSTWGWRLKEVMKMSWHSWCRDWNDRQR